MTDYYARPPKTEAAFTHGTSWEIGFIQNIGQWTTTSKTLEQIEQLLLGYIDSCKRRHNWGAISQDVARAAALEKLAEVRKQLQLQQVTKS